MTRNKKFEKFLLKSKEENPSWVTYIHLCRILQESGISKAEILKIFNEFMPKDEYDEKEKVELLDYLLKISKSD